MSTLCMHIYFIVFIILTPYAHSAIEELLEPENEKSGLPNIGRTTYLKHAEIIKEPYSCSFMQNFILHFPGTAFKEMFSSCPIFPRVNIP